MSLLERYTPRPPGGDRPRVADIGCGCGALLAELAMRFEAVGVDASPDARRHCARRGLSALGGSLPDGLPEEALRGGRGLDAAVLSDVLEHIPADAASVRAVARLLRPGGVLVCTVPAHPFLWSQRDRFHGHVRRYTRRAFAELFDERTWDPVLLSPYNTTLFPLLAAARLGKRLLRADRPGPDIRPLPRPVNGLLRRIFEAERRLLSRTTLPAGASLISVVRRK